MKASSKAKKLPQKDSFPPQKETNPASKSAPPKNPYIPLDTKKQHPKKSFFPPQNTHTKKKQKSSPPKKQKQTVPFDPPLQISSPLQPFVGRRKELSVAESMVRDALRIFRERLGLWRSGWWGRFGGFWKRGGGEKQRGFWGE